MVHRVHVHPRRRDDATDGKLPASADWGNGRIRQDLLPHVGCDVEQRHGRHQPTVISGPGLCTYSAAGNWQFAIE